MKHRSACLDPGGALNWVVYYLLYILNRDLYTYSLIRTTMGTMVLDF